MSDTITLITLTGLVATTPRHLTTSEGLAITSFRLASTQRRYDTATEKWVDTDTNWYTITCFRDLAIHIVGSMIKGQRVVVTGTLRVRDWESGDRAGTTVEVDAETSRSRPPLRNQHFHSLGEERSGGGGPFRNGGIAPTWRAPPLTGGALCRSDLNGTAFAAPPVGLGGGADEDHSKQAAGAVRGGESVVVHPTMMPV